MRRALQGVTARGPRFTVQAVPETSRGISIPAPVGGWDAITPIAAMPETQAIALDNMFPQPGYIEVRKGHRRINIIAGAAPVETLMVYHALVSSNDKLFACAGTAVYDVTATVTASISTTAMSGLANARWQHLNIATTGGNFLWACNGADAPRKYDGSTWTTASVSGVTQTDIINCAVFKKRIWLALNGRLSPAYLNTDSVQGTATVFDLVGVFQQGGALQAIGTWTIDAGDGPDDYLAFVTDRGEVAVYSGTDPATNMLLKGVYSMGAPIGRRCLTKVGADLAVISQDGVVPLSRALITDRAAAISIAITKMIQPVMNQSARDYGDNFGWQLISYAKGTRAILNVPINETTEQQQYVMNTVSGAWCRFKGENANCWAVMRDNLFYGGNDGEIVLADCQGYDDDGNIEFNVETAFNYTENRGRLKQFNMCRALLTTDGKVNPGLAVNVDFSRNAEVATLIADLGEVALWDVALWDSGVWPETSKIVTDWLSVAGLGYSASIRMNGMIVPGVGAATTDSVVFQVNGWDMLITDGGFL